jgi:hypothetical protein
MIGLLSLTLMSCGSSSNGSGDSGKLSLSLSDAPASEYKAVYVTIAEIQVHRADEAEGTWQTILTPNATYNLLDLINGTTASLGVADLATGTYTQMRLILGNEHDSSHPYANYLITQTDVPIELKVPSGFQTGIKLLHTFDVVAGRTVGLVLDFDAGRSVVKAGNSGKWQLKPTIKIINTLNNATLTGHVTDGTVALAGVTVSAQIYNASAATGADKVITVASTLTDENGNYLMYLAPGTYNIVAVADGFTTSSKPPVTVEYDTVYTEDFTLTSRTMGLITVAMTLPLGSDIATIEFRQTSPSDATQQITVKSVNYAATGSYTVNLTDGTYDLVATYTGTIKTAAAISTGSTVTIVFP